MSKLSNETRKAVLTQSMMNETRSKIRLERINNVIEDYILENQLEKDNIFCKLHNKISNIIKDTEADIKIHKLNLNKMKEEESKTEKETVVNDSDNTDFLNRAVSKLAYNNDDLYYQIDKLQNRISKLEEEKEENDIEECVNKVIQNII